MKNLIKVNSITVVLLLLSVAIWFLYGMGGFLAALVFSAVVAVYLNYNALKKKEIRLEQYMNTEYQPEILRIRQAETSLVSRSEFFENYSEPLKKEYESALEAIEEQKQRALDFLSSHDFVVERERSSRMSEIAEDCETLVRRLNDAAEEAIDRKAGGAAADDRSRLNDHMDSLRTVLDHAKGWDPQLVNAITGILTSLQEIKKENEPGNYHKLFSYYLPTTEKLIRVYRELADFENPGVNMQDTKNEVITSMALVNDAIRAMKDQSYEYKALEVAAEHSVLQTMMKQDNLDSK